MTDLLSPEDGPVYELLRSDGTSPFFFTCEHASNRVPKKLGTLGLDPKHLDDHIALDRGTEEISRKLSAHFDAPLLLARFTRLVIDLNRYPDNIESIVKIACDGTVVPGNDLSDEEFAIRRRAIFYPFHEILTEQLQKMKEKGTSPIIISIHSFTPELNNERRPWDIGILWRDENPLAAFLLDRLRRFDGLIVGDNEPYSLKIHKGFTTTYHADPNGLRNVILECRDTHLQSSEGIERWFNIVRECLEDYLASGTSFHNGI